MRKLLFAFLFTTLCHFNVKAQETSELKIGIGDAITFEILSAMENIFTGHAGGVDTSMIFPYVFVDYRLPISERSKIGIQAGYYNYNGTINTHGNELKSSAFTLLPGIDYRYLQKNKFNCFV